jgi:hypothetical protein
MVEKRSCQECGASLPPNALQVLCPRCSMAAATAALDSSGQAKDGGLPPAGLFLISASRSSSWAR